MGPRRILYSTNTVVCDKNDRVMLLPHQINLTKHFDHKAATTTTLLWVFEIAEEWGKKWRVPRFGPKNGAFKNDADWEPYLPPILFRCCAASSPLSKMTMLKNTTLLYFLLIIRWLFMFSSAAGLFSLREENGLRTIVTFWVNVAQPLIVGTL
jgi:hypothetical protein